MAQTAVGEQGTSLGLKPNTTDSIMEKQKEPRFQ